MTERLDVDVTDQVATVTLNRPDKHNAVDRDMFDAFIDVGTSLGADRSLRAVVLTGAGNNFCAGIDIGTFTGGGVDASLMAPVENSVANYFQSAAYVWRQMPVPVIAALKGVVFGAGLQIALGADIRIAGRDSRLSVMEVKWGLIPDMAVATTLPPLLSYDRAAELTWTGRIVEADEALEIGLVTRLDDKPEAAAMELARQIAGRSPDSIRAAKTLLQSSYVGRDAELLRLEAELQARVMALPNQREAVEANVANREPRFGDSEV